MSAATALITAKEIAKELEISLELAYRLCRNANAELGSKGYVTFKGKMPRNYYNEHFYHNIKNRKVKKERTMNKWVGMGRLIRDPEVRYSAGDNSLMIARYTLAVERHYKKEGEPKADFIQCVVFGKMAEFAKKYFHQGLRITVSGRMQTGSYTNNEGRTIYTTEIIVEEQEFADNKKNPQAPETGGTDALTPEEENSAS